MSEKRVFQKHKWYDTSDGFRVEFIKDIKQDGMYMVFRHNKENDYQPYYTNECGETGYGTRIL